ncbi:MAG: ATP-binding cassette domain-containing protein [Planctomycetota bacterium]
MSAPLCEVRGLEHRYGPGCQWAIDSLRVMPGQAIALTGASGSGKTTLLEWLAGLNHQRGDVDFEGEPGELYRRPCASAGGSETIGLVFQDSALLQALTVEENILLPLRLLDRALAPARRELEPQMRRAGIAHLAGRRLAGLSQGEQQRAGVLRALQHKPRLILADEPTASLDAESAARIVDLLFDARERFGAALVCVSHDPRVLERFDTRWSMEDFRVEAQP